MTSSHVRYLAYLESLTPVTLDRLDDHVTKDVRFHDPFNDVIGFDAMKRIFRHMFDAFGQVTFKIRHAVSDGDICLIEWRFEAQLRGRPWAFDGMSRVEFDVDGRVKAHIDYWDAAGAFYERLPVIGWLLAWLRLRLAVD